MARTHFVALALLAALLGAASVQQAGATPVNTNLAYLQWGGDDKGSFNAVGETTLNKTNIASISQKWNFFQAGDAFYTGLVVGNGTVYVGPTGFYGNIFALNQVTGAPVQQFNGGKPIPTGVGPAWYNAGCNLALVNNQLIAGTDDMDLRSFSADKGQYNRNWPANGNVKVPVLEIVPGGSAQAEIQASMRVTNLDGQNLIVVVTSSSSEVEAPPQEKGSFNVFNADTGALICSAIIANSSNVTDLGVGSWSTPAIQDGIAYFGTSNPQSIPEGDFADSMQARRLSDCSLVWNTQLYQNDVSSQAYPIGTGNTPYQVDKDMGGSPTILPSGLVGIIGKDGIYHAFRRDNGTEVWKRVVTSTPISLGNPSAAVNGNVVYVAYSSDVSPDSFPGMPVPIIDYLTQVAGYGGFGGYESSDTAAYYLARILKGQWNATTTLMALNASNGAILWQSINIPTVTFGSPLYVNGMVLLLSYDGRLRAFDASNGNILLNRIVTPTQPAQAGPADAPNFTYPLPPNYGTPVNAIVVNGLIHVVYTSMSFSGAGVVTLGL